MYSGESLFGAMPQKTRKATKKEADDEDSEQERLMQGLDEAHDAANDLYDMYQGEALEYYLGFGASMSELL